MDKIGAGWRDLANKLFNGFYILHRMLFADLVFVTLWNAELKFCGQSRYFFGSASPWIPFPHNLQILHRDLLPGLMDNDNSNNGLYDHVEVVQLVNRLTRKENAWNIWNRLGQDNERIFGNGMSKATCWDCISTHNV